MAMKYCPNCQTQYTDETLMFCLQDGTPLTERASAVAPAEPLDEEPTVISNRKDKLWNSMQEQGPRTSAAPLPVGTRPSVTRPPVQRQVRSTRTPLVVLTALLTALLVAAGVGAWLYFRDPPAETAKADNAANTAARTDRGSNSAPAAEEPSPSSDDRVETNAANADPEPESPAVIDKETVSDDVSQQIDRWRSLTEDGEIDELMNTYADRVDYYRRSGASAEFIRNDKERAFANFDSIKFDIANMDVSVDGSGERATAEFDKSWVFEGRDRSSGKVRQQIKLRKIDGEWRIVGERDLKLYYKN